MRYEYIDTPVDLLEGSGGVTTKDGVVVTGMTTGSSIWLCLKSGAFRKREAAVWLSREQTIDLITALYSALHDLDEEERLGDE